MEPSKTQKFPVKYLAYQVNVKFLGNLKFDSNKNKDKNSSQSKTYKFYLIFQVQFRNENLKRFKVKTFFQEIWRAKNIEEIILDTNRLVRGQVYIKKQDYKPEAFKELKYEGFY